METTDNHNASENFTLSIISPCFNESEVIEIFYSKLKSSLDDIAGCTYEIILVDDGSTDDTLKILNNIAAADPSVRICSFSRNFGHQIALSAGLDLAEGDIAVMMDSDLQHPPEIISQMIEKWKQGYDIISAKRTLTKDASCFKNITSKTFYTMMSKLSKTPMPEGVADFTMLTRQTYEILTKMPERHRFLRGLISWMGFNRVFIEYQAPERAAGTSKYSFLKMLSLSIEATLSFSSVPLKLATKLGIAVTLSGLAYLIWILTRLVFVGDLVQGWASLICVILILGGTNLIFVGLIGQYLARVFEEVKNRPVYIEKQSAKNSPLKTSKYDQND